MRVSIFFELALPRPWAEGAEHQMVKDCLDYCVLADELGFSTVWVTEHHFLEEYSHASAPEIFLAALASRTSNIRLGHGIKHMPPAINHPARIAEQVAMLDLVSDGRVELGTGESSSVAELGGFVIDPGTKRAQWEEALRVVVECLDDRPFPGIEGEFVTMPPRNVVPKPLQKPHPPLWVACTRASTIQLAADHGIGALSFSPLEPEDIHPHVEAYYKTIEETTVPIGRAVNPNVLCMAGDLMCAPTEEEARVKAGDGAGFFFHGIAHYFLDGMGDHHPGTSNLWEDYVRTRASGGPTVEAGGIGTPEQQRTWLQRFENIGVDEVMFLVPPTKPEYVMESLELFGEKVLPEFIERDEQVQAEKAKRLAPAIERAMARRPPEREIDPNYFFTGAARNWKDLEMVPEVVESLQNRGKALLEASQSSTAG